MVPVGVLEAVAGRVLGTVVAMLVGRAVTAVVWVDGGAVDVVVLSGDCETMAAVLTVVVVTDRVPAMVVEGTETWTAFLGSRGALELRGSSDLASGMCAGVTHETPRNPTTTMAT